MIKYLLPGSEFHDTLRSAVTGFDELVVTVAFEYVENVPDNVTALQTTAVASDNSSDIVAALSEDNSTLYVYSEYDIRCTDCQMMFYRMPNLCRVLFNNFNLEECTNLRRMFMSCTSLACVDMSNLGASHVEDFTEMFSGCSSCMSIDVRGLKVPSSAETCTFSDMFKGTYSLRRLSVGGDFTFSPSMSLQNPDSSIISQSNGKWNFPRTGQSFDAAELSDSEAGTYYACDVLSKEYDSDVATVESLKAVAQVAAENIRKSLKYLNV